MEVLLAIDLQQAMGHDLRTEYHDNSGREAFMGMAHYPAYVQWLESELRAARQKIKEAEQTPTNTGSPKLLDDMEAFAVACERAGNGRDARKVRSWVKQLRAGA